MVSRLDGPAAVMTTTKHSPLLPVLPPVDYTLLYPDLIAHGITLHRPPLSVTKIMVSFGVSVAQFSEGMNKAMTAIQAAMHRNAQQWAASIVKSTLT